MTSPFTERIENDWLDAIVALPDQLFYNTGIFTYVWLVTNRKAPERRGKVQLIDGTRFFERMKKSLNNKRISNATYLNEDEKRELDIIVIVSGGSSGLKVDFSETATVLCKGLVDKLSGRDIAIIVVGLGLLISAPWGFSAYLENEKAIKLAEIKSTEHQQTLEALRFANEEQVNMFNRILDVPEKQGGFGGKVNSTIKRSFDGILRAAAKTSESVINEQKLTKDTARAVRVSPRYKSEKEIIQKQIRITDINTEDELNITVVILDEDAEEQHKLKFSDSLFAEQDRSRIFEALESRQPIWLELVQKHVDDEVRSVEILRVIDPPASAGGS